MLLARCLSKIVFAFPSNPVSHAFQTTCDSYLAPLANEPQLDVDVDEDNNLMMMTMAMMGFGTNVNPRSLCWNCVCNIQFGSI